MRSTASVDADMPCKPAAVPRCAETISCAGSKPSSAATARTTRSTEPSRNTANSTATTASERSTRDAPAVRPHAVRLRARRCPRLPVRGRHPASLITTHCSPSWLRARSRNRPLAPRDAPAGTRIRIGSACCCATGVDHRERRPAPDQAAALARSLLGSPRFDSAAGYLRRASARARRRRLWTPVQVRPVGILGPLDHEQRQ